MGEMLRQPTGDAQRPTTSRVAESPPIASVVRACRRGDLMYGLVLVLPLLAGGRRGLPVPGLRVSELITVICAGATLLAVRPTPRLARTWVGALAITYAVLTAGLGALDLWRRHAHLDGTELGALLGPVQYLLLAAAIAAVAGHANQRGRFLKALVLGSIPVSLLALLQVADAPGIQSAIAWATGVPFHPEAGVIRVTGSLPHWQVLAGYLMLVLVVTASAWSRAQRETASVRMLAPAFSLATAALLCTVTIGAAVAASIACAAVLISPRNVVHKGRWVVVAALVTAAVIGGTGHARRHTQFAPDPEATTVGHHVVPTTVNYRLRVWRTQYLPVVRHNWVIGYGPDLPSSVTWPYAESIYLRMLMRGGILLLAGYLALMVILLGASRAVLSSSDPVDRALSVALLTTVIVLAVTQVIQPYFTDAGPAQVVWALAGLLLVHEAGGRSILKRGSRVGREEASVSVTPLGTAATGSPS